MPALMCVLAFAAIATYPTAPPPRPATTTVSEIIESAAERYGVDQTVMENVIDCESNGKPDAVGDQGNSYGAVQIHLPSHPNITKDQALDPEFAVDFLAKNLADGKGHLWTCYRNIYPERLSPSSPQWDDLHTIANAI